MLRNGLNIADNETQWILHFSDNNWDAWHYFRCGMRGFTSHNNYLRKKLTNKYTDKQVQVHKQVQVSTSTNKYKYTVWNFQLE